MTRSRLSSLLGGAAVSWGICAGVFVAPTAALAQSQESNAEIEEVVVTARRVEENIQEVPVAVTAVSQQKLRELAVNNIMDLSKIAPGLQTDPCSGQRSCFRPTIRGYGTSFGSGEASVIAYFAEVPNYPRSFFDLDSVQVLKGPQGTLFGETAVGGAILFGPKKPDTEFGGYVRAQAGNFNYRAAEFAFGGPIIEDKVFARFSGQLRKREGYVTAVPTYSGQPYDQDNVDTTDLRLSVIVRPFENFENYTILSRSSEDSNGTDSAIWLFHPRFLSAATRNQAPASVPAVAAGWQYWTGYAPPPGQTWTQLIQQAFERQTAAGPFVNFVSFDKRGQTVSEGVINQTRWEITDNITLRNIFGMYWSRTTGVGLDSAGDATPDVDSHATGAFVAGISKDRWVGGWPNRTWSDEIQALGNLFDNRLQWQAGYYYRNLNNREFQVSSGQIVLFGASQGNPASAANCANFAAASPCTLLGRSKGTSKAVYAQGTFAVTDEIRLTGGIRRTTDERSNLATASPTYFVTVNGVNVPVPVIDQRQAAGARIVTTSVPKISETTYNVTGDWRISSDALVYVTRRTGYKGGGINANSPPDSPLRIFGPESITNNEIGLKLDWSLGDIRGRTNFAAYKDKYKDVQRSTVIPGQALTVTQNIADVKNQGFELEATILPTEWLELGGYVALVDAKYDQWVENSTCAAQFARPQCAGLATTTPVVIDHSGGRLTVGGAVTPFSPDIVAFTSRWRWAFQPKVHLEPLIGEKVVVGLNVYGRTKWASTDSNTSLFAGVSSRTPVPGVFTASDSESHNVSGYTLVDLRVDWRNIRGSQVSAALSVTNLADKVYMAGYGNPISICGCSGGIVGEPRMWFLELNYDF